MKYKVGEKVFLLPETPEGKDYIPRMEPYLGTVMKIRSINNNHSYGLEEDVHDIAWYDYDIDHEKTKRLRYIFSEGV